MSSRSQGSACPELFSTVVDQACHEPHAEPEPEPEPEAAGPVRDLCVSCGVRPGVPRPVPLRTVHCGPCWAAHGGEAAAADMAPPPVHERGTREPGGQREWLRALHAEPWVGLLQARTRRRLLLLARLLALSADWETHATWPTWARLMSATGWSRRSVARWLQQLRIAGWLAHIESGSTPRFRPMALSVAVAGNRAAVYALRVPLRPGEPAAAPPVRTLSPAADEPTSPATSPQANTVVEKNGTPTTPPRSSDLVDKSVPTRARQVIHKREKFGAGNNQAEALTGRSEVKELAGFALVAPISRVQRYAAACELRAAHPVCARLSVRALRSLCRPFWDAGWCNTDVTHALTYRPTSTGTSLPATRTEAIHAPRGWLRSRLNGWRDPNGKVIPGYNAQCRGRATAAARHGHAAPDALPRGQAGPLLPGHVLTHARTLSAEAAEILGRSWRREHAEQLAAPRPAESAARPEVRAAALATYRDQRHQQRAQQHADAEALRARLIADARTHLTQQQAANGNKPAPTAGTRTSDTDETSHNNDTIVADRSTTEDVHAAALARARTERGTHARMPRHRRKR